MRINTHCHVFNLQSVFTKGTKEILKNRVSLLPPPFPDIIVWLLEQYMDHGVPPAVRAGAADPIGQLVSALSPGGGRKAFPTAVTALKLEQALAAAPLAKAVAHFNGADWDATFPDAADLAAFVNTALTPDMDDITDDLFAQMGAAFDEGPENFAMVPLMMDILSPAPSQAELSLFAVQLEATSRQVRRYPGRVLPFVAANPRRGEAMLPTVQDALENKGFVGVKLYPGLGYRVGDPALAAVYAYCNDNDIPLLMHCNPGGFYEKEAYRTYSDPGEWRTLLVKYPTLRICFGHFGGDNFFVHSPSNIEAIWNATILDMMRDATIGPRVFADISYNTGGMGPKWAVTGYFEVLDALLAEPALASQILWGTDSFLVRQRLSEKHYWQYFERHIGLAGAFDAITTANPRRFLGIGDAAAGSKPRLGRYLEFIKKAAAESGVPRKLPPAPWTGL